MRTTGTRVAIRTVLCAVAIGVASYGTLHVAAGEVENAPKWKGEEFSWIRGANLVPSYAPNDVVTWRDFDAEIMDRELGYAKKLGLNAVRIFLQYIVYENDPAHLNASFEKFLELCAKNDIKAMPVLFDSCFGQEPTIDWNGHWVMNPGFSRESSSRWPELQPYIDDVVGKHVGDKRIVMWDVMNEPVASRRTIDFVRHWIAVVKKMDPTHPTTVGVAGNVSWAALYAEHADVLSFHSYSWPESVFRYHIKLMKKLSAKHSDKPVIISEVGHMSSGQPYHESIRVLDEEKVGWFFWELMIAKTQFKAWQGLIYPDGTVRDPEAIAYISGKTPQTIEFEVKPDGEGVAYARGKAVAPKLDADTRAKVSEMAAEPATAENYAEQFKVFMPLYVMCLHTTQFAEEEIVLISELHPMIMVPEDQRDIDGILPLLNRFKSAVESHLDEIPYDELN